MCFFGGEIMKNDSRMGKYQLKLNNTSKVVSECDSKSSDKNNLKSIIKNLK